MLSSFKDLLPYCSCGVARDSEFQAINIWIGLLLKCCQNFHTRINARF